MANLWYVLMLNGDIAGALKAVLDSYIAYGMSYLLFGGILFSAVYAQTKSYGISGIVFILYFVLVGTAVPVEAQPFIYLLIGVLAAIMMIQVVLDR